MEGCFTVGYLIHKRSAILGTDDDVFVGQFVIQLKMLESWDACLAGKLDTSLESIDDEMEFLSKM